MAKRVLIFSLSYYPHLVGGAEVAIKEITSRLSPQEYDFDMVTLYAGKTRFERIGNVNVYRVGQKIRLDGLTVPKISYLVKFQYVAMAFLKALILHRKYHYDFIWSVIASFNSFSALFFKMIYKRVPFLLTLQEGDTLEHIKKALGPMKFLYLKIFAKADRIQVISNFLKDFSQKLGAKCPVEVVPNGVDFNHFSQKPTPGQEKALFEELKLSRQDTILVTTSRLVAKNGLAHVIDALPLIPESVKFLVIGNGPQEELLKQKVVLQKLTERVKFVGFVPQKEIPLYLSISQIFIRPSLSEGFGNSFVEAMAAGLPVIATPVGGIVDFLKDGETGVFCQVENPESVAFQVKRLMADENLRNKIVKNARVMVKEKYDWNLVAEKMKGVFSRM